MLSQRPLDQQFPYQSSALSSREIKEKQMTMDHAIAESVTVWAWSRVSTSRFSLVV